MFQAYYLPRLASRMMKKYKRSYFVAFAFLLANSPVFGQAKAETRSLLVVPLQSATLQSSALSKLNRALTSTMEGQAEFEVKPMRPVQSSAEYKVIKDQDCQSSGWHIHL